MSDPTLSPDTAPPIDPSTVADVTATTPTINASSVPEGSATQPSTGTLTAGGNSSGGSPSGDIVTTTPSMLSTVVPSGWVLVGLAALLGAGWLFIHHSKVKSEYSETVSGKPRRRKRARR